MKKDVLIFLAITIGAAVVGGLLSLRCRPRVTAQTRVANPVPTASEAVTIAPSQTNAPLRAWLRKFAVVDLNRVFAAHPRMKEIDEIRTRRLAKIPSDAVNDEKELEIWRANVGWTHRRRMLLFPEIHRIIKDRATANKVEFVLDSSAIQTNGIPFPFFEKEGLGFEEIIKSREVKDLTFEVLNALTNDAPKLSTRR